MLHANLEIADRLGRFDEASTDVVIANQRRLVGNASRLGIPQRRRAPGVQNRRHHVCRDIVFRRQYASQFLAIRVDVVADEIRVGPSEVDMLEDAEMLLRTPRHGPNAPEPPASDHDDLAGLDIPFMGRTDQIERTGLARQDPGAVLSPDR